jgi:hypothetical protein
VVAWRKFDQLSAALNFSTKFFNQSFKILENLRNYIENFLEFFALAKRKCNVGFNTKKIIKNGLFCLRKVITKKPKLQANDRKIVKPSLLENLFFISKKHLHMNRLKLNLSQFMIKFTV